MTKIHLYNTTLTWDGADGGTTINYKSYSRNHAVEIEGKASFVMSADPAFLGDTSKLNPEECLLVALSSCHMLSYLAFAAMKGVEVTAYVDRASGTMIQEGHGGRFFYRSDFETSRDDFSPFGRSTGKGASPFRK